MKRGYRLLYMIAGVMILLSAVFFEKNIGLASFMEDVFISGCVNMTMPGATCYMNPQKLLKCTVFDELMKTTVPVSAMLPGNNDDYIMLVTMKIYMKPVIKQKRLLRKKAYLLKIQMK